MAMISPSLKKGGWWVGIAGVLGLATFLSIPRELSAIHNDIVARYAGVKHMDAEAFLALTPVNTIIFDVREPSEFAVSHIAGAIQLDPSISAEAFAEAHGAQLQGKNAVFYCSVGRRASKLVARLETVLEGSGGASAHNLTGGIFQWANEGRALMDQAGRPTSDVHPYSFLAARLVENPDQRRYRPASFPSPSSSP